MPFIMKFYVSLFIILPALAFAQPADAPYRAYVDNTVELLQVDAPITPPVALDLPITEAQGLEKETVCTEIVEIEAKIECYALKYGVNKGLAIEIAKKESQFIPSAVGDLDRKCQNKKSPHYKELVYARGVYQITRCYFPEITDKQAHDPDWAIPWAMERLAEGPNTCKRLWSTCPL